MTFTEERPCALSGADRDVSLMAKDQYLRSVKWTEHISEEEEVKLLQRIKRGAYEQVQACPNQWVLSLAQHARTRLIEGFQPLVISIATKRLRQFKSLELLDVVQEGNIGLMNAIEQYGTSDFRGPFALYATPPIQHAITAALHDIDATVRVSGRVHNLLALKRRTARQLCDELGYEPTLEEIASEMGVAVQKLLDAEEVVSRGYVESLQEMLFENENEDQFNFVNLFQSSLVAEHERQAQLEDLFKQALANALSSRQREVIELRYGFGEVSGADVRSPVVVAEMLGVSPKKMPMLERGAKERLREALVMMAQGNTVAYTLRPEYQGSFYTCKQAAEKLGVTSSAMTQYARKGKIAVERREGRKNMWVFPCSVIDGLVSQKLCEESEVA